MMTLVASALVGGDCIDDADVLRTGSTAGALGCVVKVPSTLGTFLRSFRWGHVRQLDRVGRELLARAWAAGAGPATCWCLGCARAGPTPLGAPPTSCVRRWAGCAMAGPVGNSPFTMRADSGFYAHALVVVCREMDVRFSITIRQHARLAEYHRGDTRDGLEPIPYWMDGAADVAEATYRACLKSLTPSRPPIY